VSPTRPKTSNAPSPGEIADRLHATTIEAIRVALDDLAASHVAVGAIVEPIGRTARSGRYRIEAIEPWTSCFSGYGLHLSIKGVKERRDGTWGEHLHTVGGPADVRVLVPPPPKSTK
jgi:hypothetical protein